jgi:aminoglycoside phosphotransferase (APT) family kinase protein
MKSEPVSPDLEYRVEALLSSQGWVATVLELRRLKGGSSSETFLATVEGDGDRSQVVVKTAIPGLPAVGNRDVLRQALLISYLGTQSRVPVPAIIAIDSGQGASVPPMFIMSFLDGVCDEPLLGSDCTSTYGSPSVRAFDAARCLAELHRTPPPKGVTAIDLDSEVIRWRKYIDRSSSEELRNLGEECACLLLARVPSPLPPVIVHGDWRLGNMVCSSTNVIGVLDWEIWSYSDPRLDVGWFTLSADESNPRYTLRASAVGMPTARQLRRAYETAIGSQVQDLGWFVALAKLKQAAASSRIGEIQVKMGGADAERERITRSLPRLLASAISDLRYGKRDV